MLKITENLENISERLKKRYNAERVILFGSYAKKYENEDSDVDLLIIANTSDNFFKRIADVKKIIRDIRLGIPISPIVMTPKEIENRLVLKDQFINQILEEGIDL